MSDILPHAWSRAPGFKLALILLLILVFQIPLFAVSGVIEERGTRQDEVLSGIRRSWGPAQSVTGVTLAIPYTWTDPATPTSPAQRREGWIQVPPKQLDIDAALTPEMRQRGLFRATVYTAVVKVAGTLTVPEIDIKDVVGATLRWDGAILAIGATDLRGQPAGGTMSVNGKAMPTSVQGVGQCGGYVSVPAGLAGPVATGTELAVQGQLQLRGTQGFGVVPWGQRIGLAVHAPWQTPSFNGSAPLSYGITDAGFQASWDAGGNAMGSTWQRDPSPVPGCRGLASEDNLSVDLLDAVPTYLTVTRAAKYGTLFLALSFLTYFLIEQASGIRIHIAQYALLGLSVSMFALLLVSLAEPLGFSAGYAISTAAVLAQASLYTLAVTSRPRLAALFAALLAALFGVLYVIIRLESFALLAGTTTVFLTLSVVMVATRRLDWSGRTANPGSPAPTE